MVEVEEDHQSDEIAIFRHIPFLPNQMTWTDSIYLLVEEVEYQVLREEVVVFLDYLFLQVLEELFDLEEVVEEVHFHYLLLVEEEVRHYLLEVEEVHHYLLEEEAYYYLEEAYLHLEEEVFHFPSENVQEQVVLLVGPLIVC